MRLRTLFLATLISAPLSGCGSDEPVEETVVRPVRYEQVFSTGSGRSRSFSGTARAGTESRLSFKVAGTVRQRPVEVGDRVRRGDLIASLDPTDYDLQVQDASAAVTRAEAEARQAQSSYERIRQLYENRNASRNDLDQARAASEAADAAVESAKKNLELAESRLGYTRLTAPTDGAISETRVEVNENVGEGTTVAVLTSGARPKVTVTVPEGLIGGVREGDPATASFDAFPDRNFPGTVTEVGVAASRGGATFPVTVELDEETEEIRPGMAAEVTLRFQGTGRDRIYVPASAVLEDREGRFAFVVEPSEPGFGVVHRRIVEVGELFADGLEIRDGLEDGDLLVTAGVTKIQDGLKVRLPKAESGS